MEELKEYNELIKYYSEKSKDNTVTSVSEYDFIIDRLRYYKQCRDELVMRIMQERAWNNYLSAIEKKKMMDLGGNPETYDLTTEERVAFSMFDKGFSKMLR